MKIFLLPSRCTATEPNGSQIPNQSSDFLLVESLGIKYGASGFLYVSPKFHCITIRPSESIHHRPESKRSSDVAPPCPATGIIPAFLLLLGEVAIGVGDCT